MSEDDILRRDIIQSLRNYASVDVHNKDYFKDEFEALKAFELDNLVMVSGNSITILEKEYSNLVCRVFDKFYKGDHFAPDLGERV